MNSALEKLFFAIGLIDKVSAPSKEVVKSIKTIQKTADSGFNNIRNGAVGVMAAGTGIYGLVQPAQDFSKAMGEVRSLGVAETELKKLETASYKFAMRYGESASEFVRSSYDIQSAISGLSNGELAKFTNAGAVLAKGTKSNSATITSYMGTMYGIWQRNAEAMGKGEWVQQMSGQTALAVKMFKTTGGGMASAWSALGSVGQKAGASMSEQMAILGTLQSTMGGSEAATKYKAFLRGIGSAQEALGMKFVDTQGRMLPMVDIVEKIQGKFGEKLTKSNEGIIRQAFGGDEAYAFIAEMLGKTKEVRNSITQLESVKGLGEAMQMADAMTDPIDKLRSSVQVLSIAFGGTLMKTISPFIDKLTAGAQRVQAWISMFPKLTGWVGVGVLAFFAITAAISAFTLVMGMVQVVWAGVLAIKAIGSALNLWTAAQWLLNTALTANPIGIVIVLIGALIAAVAAVIYYWDELTAALGSNIFGKLILFQMMPFISAIKIVWELLKILWQVPSGDWGNISFRGLTDIFDKMIDQINSFWSMIGEMFPSLAEGFNWIRGQAAEFLTKLMEVSGAFDMLGMIGQIVWMGITQSFGEIGGAIGTIFRQLAKIPGLGSLADLADSGSAKNQPNSAPSSEARKLDIPAGGVSQSVANNRTTNITGVTINSSNGMSPGQLEEWALLQ